MTSAVVAYRRVGGSRGRDSAKAVPGPVRPPHAAAPGRVGPAAARTRPCAGRRSRLGCEPHRFGHLAGMVGLLGGPVPKPKRRPETVRHRVDPEPLGQSGERGAVEGIPTHAPKHMRPSQPSARASSRISNARQTERNTVLAVLLRAFGRDGQHRADETRCHVGGKRRRQLGSTSSMSDCCHRK